MELAAVGQKVELHDVLIHSGPDWTAVATMHIFR